MNGPRRVAEFRDHRNRLYDRGCDSHRIGHFAAPVDGIAQDIVLFDRFPKSASNDTV